MALLSNYARAKKYKFFFKDIPKNARILEIGSGSGWLKRALFKDNYSKDVMGREGSLKT